MSTGLRCALAALLLCGGCYAHHAPAETPSDAGTADARAADASTRDADRGDSAVDGGRDGGVDGGRRDAGSDAGPLPCFCEGATACVRPFMCCPATGTCEDPASFLCSGEHLECP